MLHLKNAYLNCNLYEPLFEGPILIFVILILLIMDKFTIEEINNAVQKTGFLFEQNIASAIENANFDVITNYAYLDTDEGKSREVDIVAHKQMFEIKDRNIRGVCYLICECKDSDNPMVFFVRKKTWGDKYYRPQEIQ